MLQHRSGVSQGASIQTPSPRKNPNSSPSRRQRSKVSLKTILLINVGFFALLITVLISVSILALDRASSSFVSSLRHDGMATGGDLERSRMSSKSPRDEPSDVKHSRRDLDAPSQNQQRASSVESTQQTKNESLVSQQEQRLKISPSGNVAGEKKVANPQSKSQQGAAIDIAQKNEKLNDTSSNLQQHPKVTNENKEQALRGAQHKAATTTTSTDSLLDKKKDVSPIQEWEKFLPANTASSRTPNSTVHKGERKQLVRKSPNFLDGSQKEYNKTQTLERNSTPSNAVTTPNNGTKAAGSPQQPKKVAAMNRRFQRKELHFAAAMARINKRNFMDKFDYGYPKRPSSVVRNESENVLVLYSSEDMVPSPHRVAATDRTFEPPLFTDPEKATSLCDIMNVVVTETENTERRCLVVMDHYENHHVQMWKRYKADEKLGLATRNTWATHEVRPYAFEFQLPRLHQHQAYLKDLQRYLDNMDKSVATLRQVLAPIAIKNTVTVMVSNHGQSNLLVNFVCSARSRDIKLSNVIVFATDEETKQLAQSLGLATFYDEAIFDNIPTEAAPMYGDKYFVRIMFGKVVAAHLVSMTNVDFLFQDLDIVWFKDPMKFFLDKSKQENGFDMMFQDDGVRAPRFAPFAANSGFYFARHNDRTRELFNARVLSGNQMWASMSEQAIFDALLIEHSSRYNLRVKTLQEEDFPAGHYMVEAGLRDWLVGFLRGENVPWVFHMN